MKKSADILGLPIISITEGRELGMSKTLVIDAKNGLIAAVTVEDEEWYRGVKLIPYASIIAIGNDAITILHSDKILKLSQVGDYEVMLDENIKILETKAITKTGTIQGRVSEIFVGEDGKIEKCEIRANDGTLSEISADKISIFGKQVTVIDPDGVKKNPPLVKPVSEIKPADEIKPTSEIKIAAEVQPDEEIKTAENPVEEVKPEAEINPVEEIKPVENAVEEVNPAAEIQPVEEIKTVEEIKPVEKPVEYIEEMPDSEANPVTNFEETPDEDEEVEMPDLGDFEAEPKNDPETEPAPKNEIKGIQQAEALKAALKRAMENQQKTAAPQNTAPKKGGKTVTLIGRKVTKTITADNGNVIVEAGAEITEEVLQKARIANKFIELSMSSIA